MSFLEDLGVNLQELGWAKPFFVQYQKQQQQQIYIYIELHQN